MYLALAVFAILVLSYLVILFGSAVWAPKIGVLQRSFYFLIAVVFTGCVAVLGCATAGRGAHQIVWALNAGNHLELTLNKNPPGLYLVHPWGPIWSLIPLLLSAAAGMALRKYVGKAKPVTDDEVNAAARSIAARMAAEDNPTKHPAEPPFPTHRDDSADYAPLPTGSKS